MDVPDSAGGQIARAGRVTLDVGYKARVLVRILWSGYFVCSCPKYCLIIQARYIGIQPTRSLGGCKNI